MAWYWWVLIMLGCVGIGGALVYLYIIVSLMRGMNL